MIFRYKVFLFDGEKPSKEAIFRQAYKSAKMKWQKRYREKTSKNERLREIMEYILI
jgi:hypothetical protein